MGIGILRQNRWAALLLGALFVSLSLISLLGMQTNAGDGEKKRQRSADDSPSDPGMNIRKIEAGASHKNNKLVSAVLDSRIIQPWEPKEESLLSFQATEVIGKNKAASTKAQAKQADPPPKPEPVKTAAAPANQDKPAAQKGTSVAASKAQSLQPPTILFFTRTEMLTQDQKEKATWEYALSAEELLLLQKIVMAEAEGEPYEGKVAVANVVLNRLRSANFPDTIKDVIYQKHQFSPVANGRLQRVHPNEETVKAVTAALHGQKEVSDDTYFFLSLKLAQDLTVHHSQTFAKKIGNHSFYK